MKKISTLLAALTCFLASAFAQNPVAGFTNSPSGPCLYAGDTVYFNNTSSGYTASLWNFGDAASMQNNSTSKINPFHVFSSAGTFTVTLVEYNGSLNDTAFEQITILSAIGVTPAIGSICSGDNQTLTASGGTYTWFNDSNNPSVTVTPLSTTTYTVTVTSSDNVSCTAQLAAVVYVNPSMVPIITPANPTICFGDSVTLSVTPGNSYSWSNNGPAAQNFTVSPIGTTAYSVTVTDTTGCSGTAGTTVSVVTAPELSLNRVNQNICSGSAANILASSIDTGVSYAWSNGATGSAIYVAPVSNTLYTVTAQNYFGCTVTAVSTVTVFTSPVASGGPDVTLATCSNTGAIIGGAPTATSGTPPYSYSWSPCTWLSVCTAGNPRVQGITGGIMYSVTVYDNSGCTASSSVTVNVIHDSVSVSVSPTNSSWCANTGTGITLTASVTGGLGSWTYSWSEGAVIQPNPWKAVVDTEKAGHYSYWVTASDGYNCTASARSSVIVDSVPRATAGPLGGFVVCGDTSLRIGGNPTVSGGTRPYHYAWGNGDSTANPVLYVTATISPITLNVIDSNGCVAGASTAVILRHASASVSAIAEALCPGGSDTLTATGGGSYLWSDGSTSNMLVVVAEGDSTSAYSVTVTDASTCTATAATSLNTLPVPPQPDSISYPRTVCFYSQYINFVIDAPNPLCNYSWGMTPPELWRPLSDDSAQYSFSQPGFHTLQLAISWSVNSCTSIFTDTFTVPAAPAPNSLTIVVTQPGNGLFCLNDSFTSYQWGFDNAGVSTTADSATGPLFEPANFDTLDNAYWLDVCSGGCCTRIYYNDPPALTLTAINGLFNSHLKVYPNPTSGHITISADATMREFAVYDLAGRHITTKEVYGSVTEFDLGPYQGGIYIGQVTFENGVVSKFRIVVDR